MPDYIRMLPPNQSIFRTSAATTSKRAKKSKSDHGSTVPDLLVQDRQGNMGLLTCCSSSSAGEQEVKESVFTMLRGPKQKGDLDENVISRKHDGGDSLSSSSSSSLLAACPAAGVLIMVTAGVPHVLQSSSGLEVSFASPLLNSSVTAVAGSDVVFALGFQCGRVAVFNAVTLSLLFLSSTIHSSASSGPVTGLLIMNQGSCVVSLHTSGAAFVIPSVFEPESTSIARGGDHDSSDSCMISVPQRAIDASYHRTPSSHSTLVGCSGDDCMFGILRYGGVIEISRVSFGYDRAVTVLPVLHGLLRNFNEAYSQDIIVASAHLVRNGNWLVVAATGTVSEAPTFAEANDAASSSSNSQQQLKLTIKIGNHPQTHHLFVGSLNMMNAPAIAQRTSLQGKLPHIVVHQRLQLMAPGQNDVNKCAVAYQGSHCVVQTADGLFVLNLHSAAVAKSLDDCFGIPEYMVSWRELTLGASSGGVVGAESRWNSVSLAATITGAGATAGVGSIPENEARAAAEASLDVAHGEVSAYFPVMPHQREQQQHQQEQSHIRNEQSLRAVQPPHFLHVFVRRNERPPLLAHFTMGV